MFTLRRADTGGNANLPAVHEKIHRDRRGRAGGRGIKGHSGRTEHYSEHRREHKALYGGGTEDSGQAGKEEKE